MGLVGGGVGATEVEVGGVEMGVTGVGVGGVGVLTEGPPHVGIHAGKKISMPIRKKSDPTFASESLCNNALFHLISVRDVKAVHALSCPGDAVTVFSAFLNIGSSLSITVIDGMVRRLR